MKNSHIEWTDHTFNPWEGCTKVSPGCAHCYAETRNQRFSGGANWGKGAPRRRTSIHNWNEPKRWNRDVEKAIAEDRDRCPMGLGDPANHITRPRVFCASLADWLDVEVPIEWLRDLLVLVHSTPNLDWLLLTKRPQNFRARIEAVYKLTFDQGTPWLDLPAWLDGQPPANVWIGTTVEDQPRADERIPLLLQIPAKVRFLSCEPLLGPLDLQYPESFFPGGPSHCCNGQDCACAGQPIDPPLIYGINWVIAGGESGPGARPMHPDWARSLRDQCKAAGVPFLFKQWGEWVKYIDRDKEDLDWRQNYSAMRDSSTFQYLNLKGGCGFHGERFHVMQRVGKKAAGRLLDGQEHTEFPEVRA